MIKFSVKTEVKKFDEKKLQLVLFKSMIKMQEIATRLCPFDTGKLSRSINLDPQFLIVSKYELGTGVDYGPDIEFGTVKMRAQPFLRPSLIQVRNIWLKRYFDEVL